MTENTASTAPTDTPTITSIQKVIKVGSSLAVTIPAKEAKHYGITAGSTVKSAVTPETEQASSTDNTLDAEYQAFKAQYGETLKTLADR